MLVKGKISAINHIKEAAEVVLIEYDNAITGYLPFYNRSSYSAHIGEFVVVALFNDGKDFCDGVIL